MVIAFLISVAGCWGALMVLGIFGIILWNAFAIKIKKDNLVIMISRKQLGIINILISLIANAVYFIVVLT